MVAAPWKCRATGTDPVHHGAITTTTSLEPSTPACPLTDFAFLFRKITFFVACSALAWEAAVLPLNHAMKGGTLRGG